MTADQNYDFNEKQHVSSAAKIYIDLVETALFLFQYPGSIVNHGIVANAFKDATLPVGFTIPASVASIDRTAFDGATIPAGCH